MLNLVRPKFFIPIHGELHQLHQHAEIAKNLGFPAERIAIVENGQVIEFEEAEMHLGERIPGSYVFVDGALVGDFGPSIVREREELARDGFVLVNLTFDRKTRQLNKEPEIITRGFIYSKNGDDLMTSMNRLIRDVARNGNGNLEEDLEQSIKTFIFNKTRRRPMVFVTLSRK